MKDSTKDSRKTHKIPNELKYLNEKLNGEFNGGLIEGLSHRYRVSSKDASVAFLVKNSYANLSHR